MRLSCFKTRADFDSAAKELRRLDQEGKYERGLFDAAIMLLIKTRNRRFSPYLDGKPNPACETCAPKETK